MSRGDWAVKMVDRVGDNIYELSLWQDPLSTTFNVGALSLYVEDNLEDLLRLRENTLEKGWLMQS